MVYLKFQYDLELRNCGKIEGCFFQVAGQTAHLSSGRLRRLQAPATKTINIIKDFNLEQNTGDIHARVYINATSTPKQKNRSHPQSPTFNGGGQG